MPLFWKPYTSDITQLINTLKQRDPQLEARQRQGRALLWDKVVDKVMHKTWRDANIPQKPYVYQSEQ